MGKSQILEIFERADLVKNNEVDYIKLSAFDVNRLIDILQHTVDVTLDENIEPVNTIFSHSASMSLGGSRFPCSSLECRKKQLEHLVQFAALYSDRVYIDNLFTSDLAFSKHTTGPELKSRVYNNLKLLLYLKPLIDANIIVPVTSKQTCSYCLATEKCDDDGAKCFSDLSDYLIDLYTRETTVKIFKKNNIYSIGYFGPDHLIPHGETYVNLGGKPDLPDGIEELQVVKKLKKNKSIVVPQEFNKLIIKNSFLPRSHAETVKFEVSNAKMLRSSYLSDMDLHIDLINKFFAVSEINRINNIVQKHMTTLLPFVGGLKVDQVLQIRKNEEDSFILFRKSFTDAIKESFSAARSYFNDQVAMEIYSDFVLPELAKLDRSIKSAERKLSKGLIRKIVSLTGALSFGFFGGYIPSLPAVVSPMFNQIVNFQEWLMNQSDSEETIRDENMYFLWKVKQLSN